MLNCPIFLGDQVSVMFQFTGLRNMETVMNQ